MSELLSLNGICKRFGQQDALDHIDLTVHRGEFIALLGPSGCGKTTLLRTIAGFQAPDAGTITIDGQDVTRLPSHRRPLNTVFQHYALFPHMNVLDNVAFGPRRQGKSRQEAAQLAQDALELAGLAGFGTRYPRELSGGQQQRVALARAIVNRPKLLLLDEPLSALDMKLRKRMQLELKHLQVRLGITFVFVTHDQEEAMAMADRIVVMHAGKIEQIGASDEIYAKPATRFVSEFIGEANLLGFVVRDGLIEWSLPQLGTHRASDAASPPVSEPASHSASHPAPSGAPTQGFAVLRPEQLQVVAQGSDAGGTSATACRLSGSLRDVVNLGSHALLHVDVGDQTLVARTTRGVAMSLQVGETVQLVFEPGDLHLIGAAS